MSGISRKKIRYGSGERGGQFHRRDMSGRKHFHTRTNDAFLNLSAMPLKWGRDILVAPDDQRGFADRGDSIEQRHIPDGGATPRIPLQIECEKALADRINLGCMVATEMLRKEPRH